MASVALIFIFMVAVVLLVGYVFVTAAFWIVWGIIQVLPTLLLGLIIAIALYFIFLWIFSAIGSASRDINKWRRR